MYVFQTKILSFLVARLVVKTGNFLFLGSRGIHGSHISTAKIALTASQDTLKADDFLNTGHGRKDAIDKFIDKSRSIQGAENREILKPIIDTVILRGRQNIPLRGHRDYGEFDMSTPPLENEENFRAKVVMKSLRGILNRVDEMLRYSLQESFLQFLPLEATTGKNVADTLLCDGAASMSVKFRVTQAYISEQCPKALYVHCSSHGLNLAISDSSERQMILQQKIAGIAPDSQKKKLKQLCPTRWVERYEAVMVSVQLLQPVAPALEGITEWEDKDASSNAFILLNAIGQPDFIVALFAKKLQATDADPESALSSANCIISVLTRIRENAETKFKILFRECEETARNGVSQITIPILVKGRQVHRANVPAENAEEYFRRAVFIPWADGLVSNLRARFTKHKDIITGFVCLLPSGTNHFKESTQDFIKLT
ncbi:hypothetical protein PR048_020384 [Dryococelus australis]|uniref:DUF4371 domain-containing protein n=1 Tax=Dryococelus australis TaxID=614101 RepID=A0ABQ9H675_9NEOP|nr:hypothetical protein PR048_020384 [Dryococelus australis]